MMQSPPVPQPHQMMEEKDRARPERLDVIFQRSLVLEIGAAKAEPTLPAVLLVCSPVTFHRQELAALAAHEGFQPVFPFVMRLQCFKADMAREIREADEDCSGVGRPICKATVTSSLSPCSNVVSEEPIKQLSNGLGSSESCIEHGKRSSGSISVQSHEYLKVP
ncbi:hypothetical protein F3Y22_tig00110511pilonHSYRG00059 [Hibiscus syriacus]|uniref:Uncharacterized protein n=1 Tax=Hibiscus syriacus TaxID=106335 RepID=A0A6A3AB81_HIBSY|nr:hypothetical protein F3Y22_tig00110511pilonHSYRG00059 [Hibiscus syriacus]